MQSLELTVKTTDEALTLAAEKLGIDASRLSVVVLEEVKGLFGKKQLRVRVDAPADAEATAAPVPTSEPEPTDAEEPVAEKPAEKPTRGRRREKVVAAPAPEAEAPTEEPSEIAADDEPRAEVIATEEDAARIAELVNGIITAGEIRANVTTAGLNGKYVSLQIEGKDTSHLVGKNGEVLNQFQYLLNVIITQKLKNGVRITLDGNNYRRQREEQLTVYATKIAEQVQKRGEEAVLDALPAFERRIIHKALSDLGTVKTYSEGEEPNRRVVIAPLD